MVGSDVQDYLADKVEENHLTNDDVFEICVNLTGLFIGEIISRARCDIDRARKVAELIGWDVDRAIVKAYLLYDQKVRMDEERDNTSKDPA